MHPSEEATIRAFIQAPRRARWLELLASPRRREKFLDRLNHCQDFDERLASSVRSGAAALAALRERHAPQTCYVVSSGPANLDGREAPLSEAIEKAEAGGWGTLIICIPGHLAYYHDECGERRWLLER
jgi:hypothetical protein